MKTMRAVQVSRPNGPLELVERPITDPELGSVRIKVQACGVCHSDSITKQGLYPEMEYPRVRVMKSLEWSMPLGSGSSVGRRASESASGGTAAIAGVATTAAAATSSRAAPVK
jgi:hypothetical protein